MTRSRELLLVAGLTILGSLASGLIMMWALGPPRPAQSAAIQPSAVDTAPDAITGSGQDDAPQENESTPADLPVDPTAAEAGAASAQS